MQQRFILKNYVNIYILFSTYFQTLQRKHEGVERDLAALEDKVSLLAQEAEKLCSTHPEHADQIMAKHKEIEQNWDDLIKKAKERKQKLDESYFLHRFLADFRDLTSWINDMKAVICADELAKVCILISRKKIFVYISNCLFTYL